MKFIDKDGRAIKTSMESGKFGYKDDLNITLTDNQGRKLKWELDEVDKTNPAIKSRVTLYDKNNNVVATAHCPVDPYAMMFVEGTDFFRNDAARRAADPLCKATGLYYNDYKSVLESVESMHKFARAKSVKPGERVQQLALRDARGVMDVPVGRVDLGTAIGGPAINPNRVLP